MPVPDQYNVGTRLTIHPNLIWEHAQTLKDLGMIIAERVTAIHTVWRDLKVGWVGDTSDEADAFNNEWNDALKKMFGTEADPESGVLNQAVAGTGMAALNYGVTEATVTMMFQEFTAQLSSPPSAEQPDPNRDVNTGPIHEITPK